MSQPTRIKGGKVSVKLDPAGSGSYTTPCGFSSRSVSFTKGLEEVALGDCDDPDLVNWLGRDAVSLSMSVSGEGVLAVESIDTWLDAWESVDSVACKIEIELPASTITYTGSVQVESLEMGAPNGRTVTLNVSMQSDGEMVRTTV
ncbi:MAG: phage tail tube protein [Devosia sp.]